jgi:hypothetical protein
MEKITIVINKEIEKDVEHVIIEHEDGSVTSMLKSTYDALPVVVPPTLGE